MMLEKRPAKRLAKRPAYLKASDLLAQKDRSILLGENDRLAVLGFPISHSLSPRMQNAALLAASLPHRYLGIEVRPEELGSTLALLVECGFLGLNITLPHKQAVIAHLDQVSDHARFLGAVNTILIRDQKLYGLNTDGPGLVAALEETWGLLISRQRILLLGATGGAGRAIAAQAVLGGCRELTLASRVPKALSPQIEKLSDHARHAKQTQGTIPIHATGVSEQELSHVLPHVDLIINATSLGMQEKDRALIPPHLFHKDHYCYDMVYSSASTPLMQSAMSAGAKAANGLSMLVHQGALAFQIWFEQAPPLNVMRQVFSESNAASILASRPPQVMSMKY